MTKIKANGKYVSSPGEDITIELDGISEEVLRESVKWIKYYFGSELSEKGVRYDRIRTLVAFCKQFLPEMQDDHSVKVPARVEPERCGVLFSVILNENKEGEGYCHNLKPCPIHDKPEPKCEHKIISSSTLDGKLNNLNCVDCGKDFMPNVIPKPPQETRIEPLNFGRGTYSEAELDLQEKLNEVIERLNKIAKTALGDK